MTLSRCDPARPQTYITQAPPGVSGSPFALTPDTGRTAYGEISAVRPGLEMRDLALLAAIAALAWTCACRRR